MKNYSENIDFFARKLSGELLPEESINFDEWINYSDENAKEFKEFEKIWNGIDIIKGKESVNVDAAWLRFTNTIESTKSKKSYIKPLFAIAAVATIALVSWFALSFYKSNTIQTITYTTAQTQQKEILLPDSSKISVNQNSSISYSENFENSNQRIVKLQGEAFFEVTHNAQKAFIVEINDTRVKVIGTSFLITEDSVNQQVRVIVKTGKVAVYKENSKDTIYITPGERVTIANNANAIKASNSEANYIAWKTKDFTFNQTKLQQVVSEINAAYFCHIQISDELLKECEISAHFNNKSIDEILEILEITLDITIKKQEKSIILSGKGC